MSKFAQNKVGINRTTTYEGAPATFVPDAKEDLVRRVFTTFVNEPKFYGNVQNQTQELINLLQKVIEKDPYFVAKLAIYVRNELYMRSITHMIVGELAHSNAGKPYVKEVLYAIAKRPDDLVEVLAYYLATYGKPIPNSLKKGLAKAFAKFNEYQLQKYNRKKEVELKDILCLTHPKPLNFKQADMWKRLLEDSLEIPYTWETELSAKGNTKEVWEALIESDKVGYMALLRNLRNILAADPDNITKVINRIQDPEAVKLSKQLPFRFYSAYRELSRDEKLGFSYRFFDTAKKHPVSFNTSLVLESLEKALEYSLVNLETIPGRTVLVNDDSGSMTFSTISKHSSIRPAEIAGLMMAISHRLCERAITSSFSSTYRIVSLNPSNGILANTKKVTENCQGGATYMERIFQYLSAQNIVADRIIIFSDNEAHGHPHRAWLNYKNNVAPHAWLHLIDLAGYGHQVFYGDNVSYTPGWSEKILKFIPLIEQGMGDIVDYINSFDAEQYL